jgi:hypothetical protein
MGFLSVISSGISAVCSVASSAISALGSNFSSFCASVVPRIAPFLAKVPGVVGVVANIAQVVLAVFNVLKPDEQVDDLGDRALQAAEKGIKPEKFDNFEAYMDELRNFELDPEKSKINSPLVKTLAGLAVGSSGLEKKLDAPEGSMGNLWVLAASKPEYFNPERLTALINATKDIGTVLRYFDNKLGLADKLETHQTLEAVERTLSPEKSTETIHAEIEEARAAVQATAPEAVEAQA